MASGSEDSNYHPWKKNAWQSRQAVSEALVALPKNYPPRKTVNVSEYHELAQTYLFEYFSVFEPKKEKFGGDIDFDEADADEIRESLWWEPLLQVNIPVDGVVRLNGKADVIKNGAPKNEVLKAIAGDIPRKSVYLQLGQLRQLYQSENTFQVEVRGWVPNKGPETRVVQESYYMPIAAIQEVRTQLDACLQEAGWLPQIESTPRTQITEEMLEEVEEWRQRKIED